MYPHPRSPCPGKGAAAQLPDRDPSHYGRARGQHTAAVAVRAPLYATVQSDDAYGGPAGSPAELTREEEVLQRRQQRHPQWQQAPPPPPRGPVPGGVVVHVSLPNDAGSVNRVTGLPTQRITFAPPRTLVVGALADIEGTLLCVAASLLTNMRYDWANASLGQGEATASDMDDMNAVRSVAQRNADALGLPPQDADAALMFSVSSVLLQDEFRQHVRVEGIHSPFSRHERTALSWDDFVEKLGLTGFHYHQSRQGTRLTPGRSRVEEDIARFIDSNERRLRDAGQHGEEADPYATWVAACDAAVGRVLQFRVLPNHTVCLRVLVSALHAMRQGERDAFTPDIPVRTYGMLRSIAKHCQSARVVLQLTSVAEIAKRLMPAFVYLITSVPTRTALEQPLTLAACTEARARRLEEIARENPNWDAHNADVRLRDSALRRHSILRLLDWAAL